MTCLCNQVVFEVFSRVLNDLDHVVAGYFAGYFQIVQSWVQKITKPRACSLQHITHTGKLPNLSQRLSAHDLDSILASLLAIMNSPTSLDFDTVDIGELFEWIEHTSSGVQERRTPRIVQDVRQALVMRFVLGTL